MTARQKFWAFGMGIFVWVNLLTIALSTWHFGYIDVQTVSEMGLVAFPPLAAGAFLIRRRQPTARPDTRRVAATPAYTVR